MKKYIFSLGIILVSLLLISIEPTYGLSSSNVNLGLNSNQLLDYIQEHRLTNVSEICTRDFCDYLRSTNLEEGIEIFKKKYQSFLESKTDEETAIATVLKGFPITRISTLNE